MSHVVRGNALGEALQAEGLVPPHCTLVEVQIPASGAATIQYTVYVDLSDLPKLARAILRAAEPPPKVSSDARQQ